MVEQRVNSDRILLDIYDSSRGGGGRGLTKKMLSPLLARVEQLLWSKQYLIAPMGANKCQISIHLCGEYKIRRLNHLYRNKDQITDVLSFPVHEDLRSIKGNRSIEMRSPNLLLGDIFICRQVASRQAATFGISYSLELIHLLAHGIIHLLGHDHQRSKVEATRSQKLEEQLIWKSR
ncbi:MAG: rRNA maturation RNase YbeY [Bdellovibrionales bacterium]|jgi:probable rRNA maturation factor|nr:rRNA maturation RNase YbeY [Bdellovibrionales bacterium]MBT3527270.1 rRNA maturation RNase YbeY [Bdellovibrionales bacterium]MBT7668469.1 rRNA maturation RNase YbeY [Bdellovibrionales bacterium]MBT7767153.1 rRNA maturation RNase YbeY [Bdellovibrionales bacterium]